MAKQHELLLKIEGALGSKFKGSFQEVNKKLSGVSKSIESLNKQNLEFKSFARASEKISTLNKSLVEAKSKLSTLSSAYNTSAQKTKELAEASRQAEQKVKALEKSIARAETPTKAMKSALAVAKLEAKEAKTAFNQSASETKKLSVANSTAQANIDRMNTSIDNQSEKLKKLSKSLESSGVDTNNFAAEQEANQKRLDRAMAISKGKEQLASNMDKTKQRAGSFVKTAAVTTAVAAVPIKFAVEDESVMADVAKMVDFDSVAEKIDFQKAIRNKISTDIPLAFSEMGDLIANAAGAGIQKNELLNFSEDAAKMAVAFDITGGEAGDMMAKWRSAFGLGQKEVVALADKVNYLADNTSAGASAIANITSRVGPLGEIAGFGSGEIASLGATMVGMGVGEEVAATGIKKIATSLTKGAGATKSAQAAYKKLGVTSNEVAQNMQRDAKGTLIDILTRVKGLNETDQVSVLRDIFGEEAIGSIAPLLNNIDQVKSNFELVNEEVGKFHGSMNREFDVRSDTAENKLKMLRESLRTSTSIIGETLLPTFIDLAQKLADNVAKFQEWAQANPELLATLIKVTGAVIGFVLATKGILTLVSAFNVVKDGFNLLKLGGENFDKTKDLITGGFGKISKAAKALFGLIMAHPFVAIGVAIVGIIILLYNKCEWFRKGVHAVIDFVKEKFDSFKTTVANLPQTVSDTAVKVKNAIKNTIGGALTWINDKIDKVKKAFSGIGSGIKGVVNKAGGWVSSHIPGFATGGVVTGPQMAMVGEGGAHEAIIPLDGSANALNLWNYAGQRLGMLSSTGANPLIRPTNGNLINGTSGNNYEINLNFTVPTNGGIPDRVAFEQMILEGGEQLKRVIRQIIADDEHDRNRRTPQYIY